MRHGKKRRVDAGRHDAEPRADFVPIDESAALDDYLGMWRAVKITADGATIPAESAGMGDDTLMIYGDTCDLTFSGTLLDGLSCRMDGSVLLIDILDGDSIAALHTDGTLAFELDDMIIWFERGETERPTEAAEAPEELTDLTAILETRFVMAGAEMNGYTMTAENLGGYEYSLVFHENGTVDFVMAGTPIPALRWKYGPVTAGDGKETDGMIIDFSGQPLNVVPTATGLDMDYFGTMLMHFAAGEL